VTSRRFAKRGTSRGALLAALIAVSVCVAWIADATVRSSNRSNTGARLKNRQTPQSCGLNTVPSSTKPRNEAHRSRAGEMCWRTNSPSTRHVIGYGVLADGTNVVLFGPTERPQPSTSAKSSGPSVRNCYQTRDIGASHSSTRWRSPFSGRPHVAENGSYYGQISTNTGRPKTVHVRGYYRKDGTYVRGHYRSPPRR